MTREILFRGFHEDKNGSITIYVDGKMVKGKWVEGAYSPYDWTIIGERESKPQIIVFAKNKNDGLWADVIPSTVGQFTGLGDKNGRKIFEGDIIQNTANKHWDLQIVKYGNCRNWILDGIGNKPFKASKCGCLISDLAQSIFEVTGTIFDKEVTP